MKSSKRPTESSAEVRVLISENPLHIAYYETSFTAIYAVPELKAVKNQEVNAKLGRRFSFDDNGGGYQGL